MVSKIPLMLEALSNESGPAVLEECYEFLYLVSTASEDGITTLYSSGGMKMLAGHMPHFPEGSNQMEQAMKLLQLLLNKSSPECIYSEYTPELSMIVAAIAKQFFGMHDAKKFDALHILTAILSPKSSALLYDSLRVLPEKKWPNSMRDGIAAVLQSRVGSTDKLQALILAESMVTIFGERWLVGQVLNSSAGAI